MEILPAIDLREGKCVRLVQGDYERQIDYHDDPVAQARAFEQEGAKWLHVVDLDGARYGTHFNLDVLQRIREHTRLRIEIGGGVRGEESIKTLLDVGITRVIIGTRALKEPDWFREMVFKFPDQVVMGLDARDGFVATEGWLETSETRAEELARKVNDWPLAAIIYTDIAKDGMLTGPNIEATRQIAASCKVPIIASGGVGQLADIEALAKLPIAGIIVGRALYEGRFTVKEALGIISHK